MIKRVKIQNMGAFGGAFSFIHNVTSASMQAVAIQATETIFKTVLSHVIAIAPATAESMREVISGTAACNLPAVPIDFPAGN